MRFSNRYYSYCWYKREQTNEVLQVEFEQKEGQLKSFSTTPVHNNTIYNILRILDFSKTNGRKDWSTFFFHHSSEDVIYHFSRQILEGLFFFVSFFKSCLWVLPSASPDLLRFWIKVSWRDLRRQVTTRDEAKRSEQTLPTAEIRNISAAPAGIFLWRSPNGCTCGHIPNIRFSHTSRMCDNQQVEGWNN